MARPRVIIADMDADYVVPLQLKFVKDFFEKIDLEIITDKEYFNEFFMKPQKAEILIISDSLYDSSLQRHNISNIFIMSEHAGEADTEELNVVRLFKYTSIKEIFNEIAGKSAGALYTGSKVEKETQVIVVTSANGGAGKTTVAMGISACLTENYKRVLYINAGRLQSFLHMLDNRTPILSAEIYSLLAKPGEGVYSDIKHIIRKEIFSYLPPFKASLMSLGLDYSVFETIALSAKKSKDYDFIVIDAESTFDEYKTRLLDIADKVVMVTNQSVCAVETASLFVENVNGINSDKFIFVCNNFSKEGNNALILSDILLKFTVNDYIETILDYEQEKVKSLSRNNGIQKISFLLL